jgi:hypothetical protein
MPNFLVIRLKVIQSQIKTIFLQAKVQVDPQNSITEVKLGRLPVFCYKNIGSLLEAE